MITQKALKVLLIEDEFLIALALKQQMEQLGYHVCNLASNGPEAIKQANKNAPDIIMVDIHLPGEMDGIEAARQITSLHQIPIIFMSGYYDQTTEAKAKTMNPIAYLTKPVHIADVQAAIDRCFGDL